VVICDVGGRGAALLIDIKHKAYMIYFINMGFEV
jgi:hypothetical protein